MEPFAPPVTSPAQAEVWEAYPLISPNKFLVLCLLSLGLYGLWWQYKTWRFFRQWQHTDTWPVMRAIFSLFTFHELLTTINRFSRSTNGYTPIANTGNLAAGYVILNLLARLPEPFWLVALGASACVVPAFRAFREAMLQAPAYGGREQENYSARQLIALSAGLVWWSLVVVGMMQPD
ncbi:hypothetical protein [Hymenobacter daeguensis]